jgi:phosphoenolpyruvate-protein kinase (PTS system EI component)
MSEPNPNPNPTPASSPEPSPAKTFTQEEVDAMIGKRLAKAMKGMPSDDELTAYRTWKDSQQTEQERQAQRDKEFADNKSALTAAQAEVQQLKREKYVLSKGLTGEEAEFISFKAEKMVDDKTTFEQAVDKLTENRQKVKFDWTAPAGGGSEKNNVNAAMNSLIRGALK